MSNHLLSLVKATLEYNSSTGVFTWRKGRGGRDKGTIAGTANGPYVEIKLAGKMYRAHHLAWLITYGNVPEQIIDHIDGNGRNNSIKNLRLATRAQNLANSGLKNTNTSGYKGVSYHKKHKRWYAHIRKNGKSLYLGHFPTKEEAHRAYHAAAKSQYGNFFKVLP